MTQRILTPEEKRGWARVVRSVRPLAGATAPHASDLPGSAKPRGHEKAPELRRPPSSKVHPLAQKAMAVKGSDQPAEINRARRVQRGQVDISARIDLHGMTQAEADRRLPQFVAAQRGQGARCILIITGKGRGGQGVLRRNFLAWLSQPSARAHVSAYAPAHARHGGGGAFYVFLRRRA